MSDLFEGYTPGRAWDEMFAAGTEIRGTYTEVHAALSSIGAEELALRADTLARSFLDQGITFALDDVERPFPIDPVPRIVTAQEWRTVEAGVQQRIRALELFLADAYGAGRIFVDRVVPRSVVTSSSHFHRAVAGITAQDGARVVVSGVDLIRDEHGEFRVLEDNVRIPSGVSYVLQNRVALSHEMPELAERALVAPVASYPTKLLAALRAIAPSHVTDPTIVVLTPGLYNSAYFEHTLLAREMGIELVEGRDLVCRNNRVLMRTTAGEMPVHVIYKRVDDEFCDPVQFHPDSLLGVPGLVGAVRAGNVALANAVGNGIADDKLIYTYVPDIIRYYLGEEPVLRNVETYRMEVADHREFAVAHAGELVFKPVDGSGGKGIVIGSLASAAQLAEVTAKVLADPRGWIAQREVSLSTCPTLIDGRLRPRHVDLRPFAVNDGREIWVLPGGLTRVALPEGELVVNSSQGGGSKDTWVVGPLTAPVEPATAPVPAPLLPPLGTDLRQPVPAPAPPVTDPLTRLTGAQAQQQQQGRDLGETPC